MIRADHPFEADEGHCVLAIRTLRVDESLRFSYPLGIAKYQRGIIQTVRQSIQILREEYREQALVRSAIRLRNVSSGGTLDMTADMIESIWSLQDAGEAALVRRRR